MRQPQGQAEAVVSDSCRKRGLLTMARSLVVLAVDGAVCVCVCVCVSAFSFALAGRSLTAAVDVEDVGLLGDFLRAEKAPGALRGRRREQE